MNRKLMIAMAMALGACGMPSLLILFPTCRPVIGLMQLWQNWLLQALSMGTLMERIRAAAR